MADKTITPQKLRSDFGSHASYILADHLSEMPRKKGERRRFKIVKPLPSKEEFEVMRATRFATTVDGLIGDAFAEFETLAGELDDWFNNLPESFQQGDKGNRIEEAKSALEDLQSPDYEANLGDLKTVYISRESVPSRADRRDEAVSMLRYAIDVLQETHDDEDSDIGKEFASEIDDLIGELESACDNADGIEFPGMYG